MSDNSKKLLRHLKIGDQVKSAVQNSGEIITDQVFMFLDIAPDKRQTFMQIRYAERQIKYAEGQARCAEGQVRCAEGQIRDAEGQITLTEHHLLYATLNSTDNFADSAAIFAKDINPNHYIFIKLNNTLVSRRVISTRHVTQTGYSAPLTYSGNIIVDDVASSCYASVSRHWLAHLALLPVRVYSRLWEISCSNSDNTTNIIVGVHWYAQWLTQLFPFLMS